MARDSLSGLAGVCVAGAGVYKGRLMPRRLPLILLIPALFMLASCVSQRQQGTHMSGSVAAQRSAIAFHEQHDRWPETRAEFEQGARAADVKLGDGALKVRPQNDGGVQLEYTSRSGMSGLRSTSFIRPPTTKPATQPATGASEGATRPSS